jgi:ribosomal protein RSM22 (predicted rRNA methylase)
MERILRFVFSELYGNLFLDGDLEDLLAPRIKDLAAATAVLSNIYTRNRGALSASLLSSEDFRKAYLSYFLPCNLGKFKIALEELFAHADVPPLFPPKWRVLDLGSGPGTQLLGMLLFLEASGRKGVLLEWLAVDAIEENLRLARVLSGHTAKSLWGEESIRKLVLGTRRAVVGPSFSVGDEPPFQLIVAGNLLNELFRKEPDRLEKRYKLLARITRRHLSSSGFLVLMEPALQETSRELLMLRDQLVTRGGFHVYAPCVHDNPCPAVAAGNLADWCHEDRPWLPPRHIRKIDSLIGNRKSSLKYSYAVLSRHPIASQSLRERFPIIPLRADAASSETAKGHEIWRVVSERMKEKGKSSVFLCGQPGRIRVTRLNRDESPMNWPIGRLKRGQVIAASGLQLKKEGDWRVEKASPIQIIQNVSPGEEA